MIEILRSGGSFETLTVERDGNLTRRVRGVASVYYNGTPQTEFALDEKGTVVERIAPGAFDHLINDPDVVGAVNHDLKNKMFARNGKTLKLWTSPKGLEFEAELRRTSVANDLWEDLTGGNVFGCSFGGRVNYGDKNCVRWTKEGGKDVATITRFDKLKDVSICTVPVAYKGTSAEAIVRSLEDHKLNEETLKRIARAAEINSVQHK